MKKEKDILKFFESTSYEPDFSKISNKIQIRNTKKKNKINIKILATAFASLLTISIIIPFSIQQFNQKVNEPSNEEVNNPNTEISQVESSIITDDEIETSTSTIHTSENEGIHTEDDLTNNPEASSPMIFFNNIAYVLEQTEIEIDFNFEEAIQYENYYLDLINMLAYDIETSSTYKMIQIN